MTRKWESTSKTYIPCDICGKKILFTRRNRQRCVNEDGTRSKCIKEAARKLARGEIPTARRKTRPGSHGRKDERDCLKCGGGFKPIGKYNRICEGCTVENKRYKEVATSYNVPVEYSEY